MPYKLLAIIAAILGSIATMGTGLHSWNEALTPGFVFGALGAIATSIVALHLDKPSNDSNN